MATRRRRSTANPTEVQLQNMVLTFRVSELQMLLGFAGQNKTGRKSELQSRALDMVKNKAYQSPQMISKIRELYKSIQIQKKMTHLLLDPVYGLNSAPSGYTPLILHLTIDQQFSNSVMVHGTSFFNHFQDVLIMFNGRQAQSYGTPQYSLGRSSFDWGGAAGVVQENMAMAHSSHGGHPMPQQQMMVSRNPQMSNLPGFHPLSGRTNLYGVPNSASMYPGYAQAPRGPAPPPQVQQQQPHPQQNINPVPDVSLKRIPFYEVEGVLLRPTALLPNQMNRDPSANFQFYIPPVHADSICFNRECVPGKPQEYLYQIQMRFCVCETSSEQEDAFPPGIVVKVNGKPCTLPSGPMPVNKPPAEIKRPPRPVNISTLCKLCPSVPNTLQLSWTPDYTRGGTYVVGVWCVKKLTSSDLLDKLKAKGPRAADSTVNMIKEKLQEDDDIATTELRVSLLCPLGKMMISTPVRPVTCTHLQCFDATIYLQMNEKKPTWSCPVCNKPAIYDNLVIDSYFVEVLSSRTLPTDCNEVLLNKDGSWSAHDPMAKKKTAEAAPKINESIQEINDLDSDDSMDTGFGSTSVKAEDDNSGGAKADANGKVMLVDLTATDSEDESPQPPPPKPAQPPPPAAGAQKDDVSSNGSGRQSSPSIIMLDSPSPPPREPSPPMAPAPVAPPPLVPLQRPPSSEQRSPYGHQMMQQVPTHQQMQPATSSSPYPPPGVLSHPTYHPPVHQPDHSQMQSYANYMPPSYDSRYHPY